MRIGDLRIGLRLALGFAVAIILMLLLTVVGIQRVNSIGRSLTTINEVNSVKQRYAINFRGSVHDRAISLRDVVLLDAPDAVAAAERDIERLAAFYAGSATPLDAMLAESTHAAEQDILGDIKAIERHTLPLIEQVRALRASGDTEGARRLLIDEARPAFDTWLGHINRFIDLQEDKNRQETEIATATAFDFAVLMLTLTALALLASALTSWLLARSVTRPLRQALEIARRVSDGDLEGEIDSSRRDEVGGLLRAMQRMRLQLHAVFDAQIEMARRHDEGAISHRIDASAFPGKYGDMVRESNALVAGHIGRKMRLLEIMQHYAIGDLAPDMDRLRGESSVISETMDVIKANLTAVNSEIRRLVHAAADGDFSARGNQDRFQHEFHEMIAGLNRLMSAADGNLADMSQLLRAVADGDLTARMDGDYQGVFAQMRDDANRTVTQLTSLVGSIQRASRAINTASSEIVSGNNDLSRRTEQQAANLQETSSSMVQFIATVRQNAEHAHQANQLAIGAAGVATRGGDVVGQVVGTMREIEQSSRRIAEIISVIDGIAFQTNILALNAAVEAARAGEQGRGFAVVAAEVRSLAQRSATAAREIKGLIEDSVSKVGNGSALASEAGRTMVEMVASVQRVTDIMAEISAASQEQASGIEQVNQTITQMDETTQQNAALVEEASAAARSMEEQAGQLADVVSVFQMHASDTLAEPVAAATRTAGNPAQATRGQGRDPAPRKRVEPALATAGEDWQEF